MLNSEAQSEYLTSQLSWEAVSLLVTYTSHVYPLLWPHIIWLIVILLTVFLIGKYGFTSMGS